MIVVQFYQQVILLMLLTGMIAKQEILLPALIIWMHCRYGFKILIKEKLLILYISLTGAFHFQKKCIVNIAQQIMNLMKPKLLAMISRAFLITYQNLQAVIIAKSQ